ncbi:MAG: hypothetical protein B7C24_14295 [Bacteroidetes bacterium 4572_77]|nr:MAG: hypothetical protein B7C24_14295 [Bacteroidetes bacterium 4572_77]
MPTNDISEKRQNRQLSEMKQVTGNNKIAQGGVQHGVQLSDVSHNNMKLKDLIASFEWVPVDQGVQLTLVSRRTIFNKINKGQIAAIKIPDPTCGQRTFIKISDLSPLAEMKWHEIQTKRLSEHLPAVIKKEKKKFEMGSQHDRDIAWARLSIIKSFYKVQEIAKKEGKRKSEADKLFLHKLEDREILKEEMKLLDLDRLGLSTVKRWIKQYNDSGNINFPVSLLPSKKGKVGRKRIKATEIRARIRTLASEDVNLPATIIYRMLLAEFDLDEETCPLRPSTVYSDVRKIRSDIFIMAGRKGKESYKNMVKPHLHRLNDAEPGEIWESDGHRMNNACYNPFFYQEGYKPLIRPILVAWFDIATGMITSWALGANESFHLMVTSFRQGLQDFGAPKKVRVDNGSGYRNAYTDVEYFAFRKTKTKTNSKKTALELYQRGYRGFFQECGVEKVQFTIPGNSESKAIEPAWRYTLVEFEKTVSLFLGETAEKRPEKYRVSYKKLIKQFGDEILTWNEYVAALDRAINNYNNSKRKVLQSPSGELSPIEMYYQFPENINKLSIPEIEYQCRDMFPKPCTVSRGEIKIMGMYYRHPLLVDYLGRKVNVYYDERNLESVQVGTLDGEIWTTPAKRIIPSSQMNPEQFEKAIKANNHYQKEMIATYANIHNNAEDLSIEQKNEIADSSVEQLLLEQANTQERIKNNQHKMITSRFTIENIKNTELKTKDVETEPEEKTESPFLALSRKVKG